MFENKVKTLLAEGKAAWGAGLPDRSDFIAKLTVDTGIDFLWIDTEHRPYQPVAKSGFLGFMFFSNAGVEMA